MAGKQPYNFVNGVLISDVDDALKQLRLKVDPTTISGKVMTILSKHDDNYQLILPNANDTLVGKETSDIFKHKTIDGDDNTVQDLALSSLKTILADANKILQRDATGAVISDVVARAGLAAGTANHVLINDALGALSSEARLDRTRGGTGITSTATFPSTGTIAITSDIPDVAGMISSHAGLTTTHGVTGAIVGTSDVQIFTNKTFDDELRLLKIITPIVLPDANHLKLYAKTGGDKLYTLNSAGVETELGASGGSVTGDPYAVLSFKSDNTILTSGSTFSWNNTTKRLSAGTTATVNADGATAIGNNISTSCVNGISLGQYNAASPSAILTVGIGDGTTSPSGTFSNKTTANGLTLNSLRTVYVSNNVIYILNTNQYQGYKIDYSTDNGENFNHINLNNSYVVFANDIKVIGNSIYVAHTTFIATHKVIAISRDGGANFSYYGLADGLPDTDNGNCVFVDGLNVFIGTNDGLGISRDGGYTWTYRTTTHGLGSNHINAVWASGDTVYVGTTNGFSYSTDSGNNIFTNVTGNGLVSVNLGSVQSFGTKVYVLSLAGHFHYSIDGGHNFTHTFSPGYGSGLNSLYVDASIITFSGKRFSGTNELFYSIDDGSSFNYWDTSNGLGSGIISDTFVNGNIIYAATYGGFSISGSTTTQYCNALEIEKYTGAAKTIKTVHTPSAHTVSGTFVIPVDGLLNHSYIKLSSASSVVSNGTTPIAAGEHIGQELILQNVNTIASGWTITIQDAGNTQLTGGNFVMSPTDTLRLIWDGSFWVMLSGSHNQV